MFSSSDSVVYGVSMVSVCEVWLCCQFISGLNGSSVIRGVISIMNRVLKYGGLIEILFSLSVLVSSGYRVLSRIMLQVVVSSRLLVSSRVLCEVGMNLCWGLLLFSVLVCSVYSSSVLLMIRVRNIRMKVLCEGLVVNECMLVSMFECIRKVFSSDSVNVVMVSSSVQLVKLLCFLVIVWEWISVVLVSYGRKLVFFIGFQNYQLFQLSLQYVYQLFSVMLRVRKFYVMLVYGWVQCSQCVFMWFFSRVVMVKVNGMVKLIQFRYSIGGWMISLGFCSSGFRLWFLSGVGSSCVNGLEVKIRNVRKLMLMMLSMLSMCVCMLGGSCLDYSVIVLFYSVNISVYSSREFLCVFYIVE